GVLVAAVAAELVELLREEIRPGRRIAGWERRRLAVDLDTDERVGGIVLERDLAPQPRPQPAREQLSLCGCTRYANVLHVRDPRPQRRELWPPATRSGPRDVRDGDAIEDPGQASVARRQIGPLGAVDDQAVDHVDETLEIVRAERRQPAPAQKRREVGQEQRLDDARRYVGAPALEPDANRLGADAASLPDRIHADLDLAVEAVL